MAVLVGATVATREGADEVHRDGEVMRRRGFVKGRALICGQQEGGQPQSSAKRAPKTQSSHQSPSARSSLPQSPSTEPTFL